MEASLTPSRSMAVLRCATEQDFDSARAFFFPAPLLPSCSVERDFHTKTREYLISKCEHVLICVCEHAELM